MSVKFTEDHEWISVEGDVATIGITAHALEQLGDLVFVEVPEAGRTLDKGDEAAVVESVKAASEINTPVSGEVTEGNALLGDDPEAASGDPAGDGWFFKIKMSDPSQLDGLMDEAAYKAHIDG